MSDTTLPTEPSGALKANAYLMECWQHGLPLHECERRLLGAERLRERLSSVPFYARQAKQDPWYWNRFYASGVNG